MMFALRLALTRNAIRDRGIDRQPFLSDRFIAFAAAAIGARHESVKRVVKPAKPGLQQLAVIPLDVADTFICRLHLIYVSGRLANRAGGAKQIGANAFSLRVQSLPNYSPISQETIVDGLEVCIRNHFDHLDTVVRRSSCNECARKDPVVFDGRC
jgi:hypothetical protein